MRLNKIQKTAVSALEDIKARDITVLDVRKLTSLYDTLIIASAESNRQVKALAHHVRDKLKEAGATIIGVEGEETGEWVLVDCRRHRRPRHAARGARVLQPRGALGRRPQPKRRGKAPTARGLKSRSTASIRDEAAHRRARPADAGMGRRAAATTTRSACRASSRSSSSS